MFTVDAVVDALVLEPVAPDRYRAGNVQAGHQTVFGGQLLAQSIVAALQGNDGKTVKTLHTVFARGAVPDTALEVSVDRMHAGRGLASSTVTISQGDRLCTRSLVLLSADEPDLIRHADTATTPPPPPPAGDSDAASDAASDGDHGSGPGTWQVHVAGGVDISDPDAVGPPELDVWTRWPGAPADPATNQALLAFATDSFLIGTAMRPHKGIGQAQAHVTISTGVLSHTITFHEPCLTRDWLLLTHRSPHAGRGRSYGRADAFRGDGHLVASFVQDNLIRAMPTRSPKQAPLL